MRKIVFIFLTMLSSISAYTQVSFSAKTGDSEFDATLNKMNVQAKADLSIFKKDLSVSFNIGEEKLNELMLSFNMQPADLYMTLQIARLVARPVDQVATSFKKNQGKGWGVIAKEMGIKPGSQEFHTLKNSAKGKSSKMKEKKGKGKSKSSNGKSKGKNK